MIRRIATSTPRPVRVTGVSISNPSVVSVIRGWTVQLIAIVAPTNATNKNVTWNSDHPAIASVNASGIVNGIAVGTTRITVRTVDGGFMASVSVNVTPFVHATGIWLEPNDVSISVGGSAIINVHISPHNATNKGYLAFFDLEGGYSFDIVDHGEGMIGIPWDGGGWALNGTLIVETLDGGHRATATVTMKPFE